MSEIIPQTDPPAIELIDEQVAALNADIAANTRRVELRYLGAGPAARGTRNACPQAPPRKARPVSETPANDADDVPRPSVFAGPVTFNGIGGGRVMTSPARRWRRTTGCGIRAVRPCGASA